VSATAVLVQVPQVVAVVGCIDLGKLFLDLLLELVALSDEVPDLLGFDHLRDAALW
jgi:hypothetical protein